MPKYAAHPPVNADYLVGTANSVLSAEIPVGTSPGGELGGTWASPTVDTTHSGSAHVALTANTPAAVGTAGAVGTGTASAKDDHVHAHEAAHINHDTTWAAKGDLIAGTANDTAAVLTAGADDTILMADSAQSTGLKWVASGTPSTQAMGDAAAVGTADTFTRGDHKHAMPTALAVITNSGVMGTSFPGSPATNDRFFRTDLAMEFYYDGTRWLSTQLFYISPNGTASALGATTNVRGGFMSPESTDKWLIEFACEFMVNSGGTALDGSNNWVLQLKKDGTGASGTSVGSAITINSGASGAWRVATPVSLAVLLGTTFGEITVTHTKTGTPGTIFALWSVTFRIVGA